MIFKDHGYNWIRLRLFHTPAELPNNLEYTIALAKKAKEYKLPIILVEVAYNASAAEYKNKPAPFPETPEGQREFLDAVNNIVLNTPENLGTGIFWWEPATMGSRSPPLPFPSSHPLY
jgi:arabinogalactan endo-1,4-beta-galactosidase